MGDYTEAIIGCKLKESTPQEIIDTIQWMCDEERNKNNDIPANLPAGDRTSWMFWSAGSYYFGTTYCPPVFRKDDICDRWCLMARFNIKNYTREIENFLEWLKPHVDQGIGARDIYAIVTFETGEPQLYALHETTDSEVVE